MIIDEKIEQIEIFCQEKELSFVKGTSIYCDGVVFRGKNRSFVVFSDWFESNDDDPLEKNNFIFSGSSTVVNELIKKIQELSNTVKIGLNSILLSDYANKVNLFNPPAVVNDIKYTTNEDTLNIEILLNNKDLGFLICIKGCNDMLIKFI